MSKNIEEGKEWRKEEKETLCALVFYLYDPVFLDVSVACSDKGVAGSQAHHQARFITRMIIDVFYTLRQYIFCILYTHLLLPILRILFFLTYYLFICRCDLLLLLLLLHISVIFFIRYQKSYDTSPQLLIHLLSHVTNPLVLEISIKKY